MGAHEPGHLQSKHLAAQSKRSPKAFDDLTYPIMWLVGWVWGRRGPGKHWAVSGRSIQLSGGGLKVRSFCSRAHTNKLKNWSVFVCFPCVRLVTQLDETSYLMYEHNVFISQVFFLGSLQVTNVSCKNTFLQFKKKNMFFLSFTLKIVLVMIHHPHTQKKVWICNKILG